jgi:hypothetical protein
MQLLCCTLKRIEWQIAEHFLNFNLEFPEPFKPHQSSSALAPCLIVSLDSKKITFTSELSILTTKVEKEI